MRGTGRIILSIFGVCALVIFYVHLQVVTFLASYDIQRASYKIHLASDQLRNLKFEMEQFKAPHLLEGQVHQYEMQLALPEMVYRVPQPFEEIQRNVVAASFHPSAGLGEGVSQAVKQVVNSWIQVAHAKNDSSNT